MNIIRVGSMKEPYTSLFFDYAKRLKQLKVHDVKDNKHAPESIKKLASKFSTSYILDAQGLQMTSEQFAQLDFASCVFIVGPAQGFDDDFKKQFRSVSLSRMTFPHDFASCMLVEQLYRATQIQKGSAYHK